MRFDWNRLAIVLLVAGFVAMAGAPLAGAGAGATDRDPVPTVQIGDATAQAGETVTKGIDITTDGEEEIELSGYHIEVHFDPSVVAFEDASGVEYADPTVGDGDADDGVVTLVATDGTGPETPFEPAVELEFEAVGEDGDTTPVEIETENSALGGPGGEEYENAQFVGGDITISGESDDTGPPPSDDDGADDGSDDGSDDESDDGSDDNGDDGADDNGDDGAGESSADDGSSDDGTDDGSAGESGDEDGEDDNGDDGSADDDSDDGGTAGPTTDDQNGADDDDGSDDSPGDDADDEADGIPAFGIIGTLVAMAAIVAVVRQRR